MYRETLFRKFWWASCSDFVHINQLPCDDMILGLMDVCSRWSVSQQSAKPDGISKNMSKK